jgi:hypothetical protein
MRCPFCSPSGKFSEETFGKHIRSFHVPHLRTHPPTPAFGKALEMAIRLGKVEIAQGIMEK